MAARALVGGEHTGTVLHQLLGDAGQLRHSLILMVYLVVRLGGAGRTVPVGIGWGLLIWSAGCVYLIGPSGFILILLPSVLLVAADLGNRRRRTHKV